LVEMVESAFDHRTIVGGRHSGLNGRDVASLARRGSSFLQGASAVVYAGENHSLLPIALFSAAGAGVPFVPVNYRLEDAQLNALVSRHPGALVLADSGTGTRLDRPAIAFDDWLGRITGEDPRPFDSSLDDGDVAIVLFTSGTTAEPKSALLRHRHLMAYLLGAVEFAGAGAFMVNSTFVSIPGIRVTAWFR
jgi:acyl-CoA synthetase (AMP-forming)/AMP-acid ligase II